MSSIKLNLPSLVEMPVAVGATSPVPRNGVSLIWSTIENDMLLWDGMSWGYAGYQDVQNIYAAADFSTVNHYASAGISPEVGSPPFGGIIVFRLLSLTNARYIWHCFDASSPTSGWGLHVNTSGVLVATAYNAAGSGYVSPGYPFTQNDLGKLFVALFHVTSTSISLTVNRAAAGPATTMGGTYAPSTAAMRLGTFISANGFSGGEVTAMATYRGTLTAQAISDLFVSMRLTADIPTSLPGATLTHRWSLKEMLLGQDVSMGQTAPATLLDTNTFASTDTLNRIGAPKISIIDARREGRVSHGISSFAGDYRIESAAGKGIRGKPSGFWVSFTAQIVGAVGGYLAGCGPEPVLTGWGIYRTSGGTLWAYCGVNASNMALAVSASPTLNTPFIVHMRWTGTTLEFYLDGVLQGTSAAGTYTAAANTVWMTVGNNNLNTYSTPFDTVYALAGGDQSVTANEIVQNANAYKRTGRLQPIANKTDHFYDFTADILDQSDIVSPAPVTVLDQVGTHHLTQVGGYVLAHGGLLCVDTPISGSVAQTYYRATSAPSGINPQGAYAGAVAGFTVTFLHYNTGEPVSIQATFITNTDLGLAAGFWLGSNNQIVFQVRTTTGIVTLNLGTEPTGYVHTAVVYDGSTFKGYVNGTLTATSATGQVYTPSTVTPVSIGSLGTSYPAINRGLLGATVGDFVLSAAEVSSASTQSRTNYKIYATPNKVTRHWSIVDDIADAGYTVPTRIKDRIGGVVNLGLQMPLTLRRLQSLPGEGLRGGTSMWAAWYGVIDDLMTPNAMHFINCVQGGTAAGFIISAVGANGTQLTFRLYYGDGNLDSTGGVSFTPADVGVPLLLVAVRTAANTMHLYKWNSQVGGGNSNFAYVAANATTPMSANAASSGPIALATNFRTLGVAGSDAHELTAPEVASLATYVRWAGRIVPVAGKTQHLWVNNVANTRAATKTVPLVLKDRVGSDSLSTGLGILRDYTLIARGDYRGITGTHTYRPIYTRTGVGLPGSAAGFWASVLVSHEQLYAYPRIAFGQWGSGAGGWQIGFSSSGNPRPQATVYESAAVGKTATGTTIFRQGDMQHVTLWYDNITLKLFVNGVLEKSEAFTGYLAYGAGNTGLLCADRLGTYAGFGIALYGAAGGNILPTDTEILTSYLESMKKNTLVAIPGKTSVLYDVRQDVHERNGLLPNQFKDRANGTSHMVRTGNHLETITTRLRNWSYETTPTLYGVTGFSASNYLKGYTTGTCAGDPWSFFACVAFIVNSQAGASGVRTLLASRNATTKAGWAINTGGSNASVSGLLGTAGNDYATTVGTMASTLVGKLQFATVMYDGLVNRAWFALNALQVGSYQDLSAGGYFEPRTGVPLTLGILSDMATQAATDITILGAAYGNAHMTAAEHRQMYHDFIANETFPRNVKMTSVWDISTAIKNNNGALPGYIVDDVSGNSLQIVGTPTVDTLYHRSFAT